jgi:hypothetical protein
MRENLKVISLIFFFFNAERLHIRYNSLWWPQRALLNNSFSRDDRLCMVMIILCVHCVSFQQCCNAIRSWRSKRSNGDIKCTECSSVMMYNNKGRKRSKKKKSKEIKATSKRLHSDRAARNKLMCNMNVVLCVFSSLTPEH